MSARKHARKPGDLSSGSAPKRREPSDVDRLTVITAILNEHSILDAGHAAGLDRFDAEAIITAAGWSNRGMLEAARDRYTKLVEAS